MLFCSSKILKMSVSNPVDSGGGGGVSAISQDLQEMEKQMNTVGGWAEIMAVEHLNSTVEEDAEDEGSNEREGGDDEPDSAGRKLPTEPPFKVQVTNISTNTIEEDVFFHFGGEPHIMDLDLNSAGGRAVIEFIGQEGLRYALDQSGTTLDGKQLKVFLVDNRRQQQRERNSVEKQERRGEQSGYPPQQQQYRHEYQQQGGRGGYPRGGGGYSQQPRYGNNSRHGSQYGSQASLASNDRYDNRRPPNSNYNPDYRGPPSHGYRDNDRRGYRDSNRGGYRGGYNNHHHDRQSYGGPGGYDRHSRGGGRHSYGGPPPSDLQRSSSYSHDNERPAPIHRSHTDSHHDFRHPSDGPLMTSSRASSRLSINTEDSAFERRAAPVIKKPSSRDIFGDAKPVDTAQKMKEIDEKLEKERKLKAEADKAARDAAAREAAAASAAAPPLVSPAPSMTSSHHEFNVNAPAFTLAHVPQGYAATLPNPKRWQNNNQQQNNNYQHQQYRDDYQPGPPRGTTHYGRPPHNMAGGSYQHQQQNSQFYHGPPRGGDHHYQQGPEPGSVTILQRPDSERDSRVGGGADSSPPLDPVHSSNDQMEGTGVEQKQARKDDVISSSAASQSSSLREDRTAPSSGRSDSVSDTQQQTQQTTTHKKTFSTRTFTRSDRSSAGGPLQKSATSGQISEGTGGSYRGRGGRGGRGGARGGSYRGAERRGSYSSTNEGSSSKETQREQTDGGGKLERRDHHGSQTSVRSRGSHHNRGYGSKQGRGGGNSSYKPRDERRSRGGDDRSLTDQRPPKQYPTTGSKAEGKEPKPDDKSSDSKQSVVSAPKDAPETAPIGKSGGANSTPPAASTPTDKKKEKKKNKKNNSSKVGENLISNKFAALCESTD